MEPLSIAGSIAGLVAIADIVFSRTYRYAKAVKSAANDIEKLSSEIRSLSGVLHGLSLVVNELEKETTIEPNLRLHHINSCRTTLIKIQRKLEKNDPATTKDGLVQVALRSLKWPFSTSETKELLAEIGRHKATIGIALSADNMAALLRALSRQDELADGIQDIKSKLEARWAVETRIAMNKERQDILNFFEKIDPSPNHETSLKLRHPLTGLWLTEGEAFKTWLYTRNSKLWLSGIPGAGKTVLAASVIEEAIKESSPNRAVAYFYCDYKDERTQDPVNILGSLATQLGRQCENCFALLRQHYFTCHPVEKAPLKADLAALSRRIREMALTFDDVSIIVDGLDECGTNTTKVVESLVSLGSDTNSNTRTLLLSRSEYDIRQLLQEHYSHIEIAANSEDLRLYVAAEIETRMRKIGRGQLRIKNPELKQHIMETLVTRADGM
jgi:NACHT domain/Fungal N-terminal domain of STAND proteins